MNSKTQGLKDTLANLPGVQSVDDIEIEDNIIEYFSFDHKSLGKLAVHRLVAVDSPALFDFYFQGLSEGARSLFPPYPLFSPPLKTAEELAERIVAWREESDWTSLILTQKKLIIGMCLLKRWSTKQPTSGLAVHEGFRENRLGLLLQTIVTEQALLLELKRVCATVAPDNTASLRVHQKCGFKKTGRMVPHYTEKDGVRVFEREDVELVLELKYG